MFDRFVKWTVVICGLSLLYACVSSIEFDTLEDAQEILTIQASLVQGSPHTFAAHITTLNGFEGTFTGGIGTGVTLFNELGQQVNIPRIGPRDFRLEIPASSPDFVVEDYMKFRVRISTNDGRTFDSSMEQLLPVPEIEELEYSLIEILEPGAQGRLFPQTRIGVFVTTSAMIPNTQDNVSLRWTFEEVFRVTDVRNQLCYVTQGIRSFEENVFTPTLLTGTRLDDFQVFADIIRATYSEGNYLVALQQSLTPSAAKYFEDVNALINRDPSIFTGPGGKIQSNFTNINDPEEDVFGYFFATTIDTVRLFIPPESVGSPAACCVVDEDRAVECQDVNCGNCLRSARSTTERPFWWE